MVLRFVFILFVIALIGFGSGFLLKRANYAIWQSKPITHLAKALPFILPLFALMWWLGFSFNSWLRFPGAAGTAFFLLINISLILSLPIARLVNYTGKVIDARKDQVDPSRRRFIKTASAIAPVIMTGIPADGFVRSFSNTTIPQIDMEIAGLPDDLDGFKILQLSDLHLGYYFGLDHLEKTLQAAEAYRPDMLVVTGDIADDLSLMTDAMKLTGQLKTPYPAFASIGNHEYFRGIKASIRNIEAGPIPLLLNKHADFMVGKTRVCIGGADDPVTLRSDIAGFLDRSLGLTFKNAPPADFRLLMSHRPRALDLAEKHKVNLILSGHTHGGQIGINGRSLWDAVNRDGYLWGKYARGDARLYTTSGMGHWFPFRLGCPLEAPVITLRKAKKNTV